MTWREGAALRLGFQMLFFDSMGVSQKRQVVPLDFRHQESATAPQQASC